VLYGPPFFRLIMGHAPLTKEFSEAIHVVMVKRPGDFGLSPILSVKYATSGALAQRTTLRAEARHAEVNSRRSVFCSGPLDRRAQAKDASAQRSDTPEQVGAERQTCPRLALRIFTY
jgi:hypothetical protein